VVEREETRLLTQQEVEERMYAGGIQRACTMMANAEEKGRAATNPYAKEVFAEYVLPLAEVIRTELDASRPGRRQAHAALLKGLNPDAVAFLAVRACMNGVLMQGQGQHRAIAYDIGRTIHNELVLIQIEDFSPELYHTLARDLGRRLSKDERHRMTVFKMQAAKAGILISEWPIGARDQVGLYLLGLLEQAGMVEIAEPERKHGKQLPRVVTLAQSLMERIDQIKSHIAITLPVYGPCVEPPRDWTTPSDGGFHTRELRRTHNTLVRHRLARTPLYQDAQMPLVLEAVNGLQRTAWQVNERMLDTVLEVAKHFSTGEVTSLADIPKPAAPVWLTKDMDRDKLTEDQAAEFKRWKRQMADWYTERKLSATRYGRFYSATRAAEMFRGYPSIYFVYFADSRGRLYPMTYGLNPQGSDLQRALIRFSKGLPLDTPDAIRWFHVQGANKFGFDKATLAERQQWVVDRQDLILSFAADPVNNTGWKDADKPLQFLAWAMEYRDWVMDQTGSFLSHLPISMDGSCNGLQNLSALLRDEIGGEATNLTANVQMQDIYRRVAEKATARLETTCLEDTVLDNLRLRWLKHGIERSVVKRSVMTTPYGVTKRSAIDYVVEDYLRQGKAPLFERTEYSKAATVLMGAAWPAIGDVVVKGRECMDWLRASARAILKTFGDDDDPVITWVSPSGFPASQAYYEAQVHQIRTRLAGESVIRVHSEGEEPDTNRHANGLAPNFIHSMDAAHLHLTATGCLRRGIDALAMIHDDYGTHAANAQALYEVIREQFVWMYENHDPVTDFKKKYPCVPEPPTKGSLDIREVLQSPYFFS
jgi:DNA-directed RNA polymerase